MSDNPNQFLNLMNFKSAEEAYVKVKQLASSLSDKEHLIRSCIFDLHAAVEVELRRVFYHTFHEQLFLTDDEGQNKKVEDDFEKMIDRLSFMDMYRILKPILKSWQYGDLDSIGDLNETRNKAAHGGDVTKVRYKGRNPFEDGDCFAQMYFDVWAIKDAMGRYFGLTIERPKIILKRYIDKYGADLI